MSEPERTDSNDGPTPHEFLAALMRLSPEDAAKARANSPARRRRKPQEGPVHDYGDAGSDDNDR
jgi:hypothetical protein